MNVNVEETCDTEIKNFESLKYEISDNDNILLNDFCGPDVNFFNENFQNFDTPYLKVGDFDKFLENSFQQLSILHLNIRSIKKNFDNFKFFLNSLNFTFSVICLSETLFDDLAALEKSLFE